jgi:hypothetical protein
MEKKIIGHINPIGNKILSVLTAISLIGMFYLNIRFMDINDPVTYITFLLIIVLMLIILYAFTLYVSYEIDYLYVRCIYFHYKIPINSITCIAEYAFGLILIKYNGKDSVHLLLGIRQDKKNFINFLEKYYPNIVLLGL